MESAKSLVARYLRYNGYDETLEAFIKEAGLPLNAGSQDEDDMMTLEKLLHEKEVYDLAVNYEKLGDEGLRTGWCIPNPNVPDSLGTLPTSSNILSASVEHLLLPGYQQVKPCVIATTSDRRLNIFDASSSQRQLLKSLTTVQDSPILSYAIINNKYLVCSGMSGKVVLYDIEHDTVIEERRDHRKYVVKVACWLQSNEVWLATAGWDGRVMVYHMVLSLGDVPTLGEPVGFLEVPTQPECILFLEHPETNHSLLLLTRRDSTYFFYYRIPYEQAGNEPGAAETLQLLGKQNLAPYSNSWIAFTPSMVSICPRDPLLVAVATSAVPHMKLIIVRLLLPSPTQQDRLTDLGAFPAVSGAGGDDSRPLTQTSYTRLALAVQDREAAAIIIHCTTLAPQTPYSTPSIAWRPNGSGVWVNGDDGIVRGIEATTGKVAASLHKHDAGSKIRCLWAGLVDTDAQNATQNEWLVSGGFDHNLIIWTS